MRYNTPAIIIGIKTPGQPKRFHDDDDENDNKDGCLKLSSYLLSWGCQCKKIKISNQPPEQKSA